MHFARSDRPSAPFSRGSTGNAGVPSSRPASASRGKALRPRFDIRLISDLLDPRGEFAPYAGIGSRETPADVLADMTLIAEGLERLGFTLRSGFAGGADTAFELGTSREALREIFAPWKGFGSNPNSKWDKPRWDQIRAWEARTGRRFQPAKALQLSGEYIRQAEALAAQHHAAWDRLSDANRKLHSRNMGQVLGAKLDQKARFVIAWTIDGQDTGGTGQAIRVADALGIPVLNLHDADVRAEIIRLVEVSAGQPVVAFDGVSYHTGDVSADDADLLVNTVNCASVMGKGIALQFKTRFPDIMTPYSAACRSNDLKPGGCMLFPLTDGRQWAALATKNHWRLPAQLDWVRSGLQQLAAKAHAAGVRSIAIPPVGCTNGGLVWAEVEPLIIEALSGFDLRIYGRPSMSGAR